MTNKEKEKLIKSFKSFKYNPETNIKEEYTNVGIDWCIEEIQECDCGKKDKLDEILEKYRIQKLKEEKTIEFQTDEIKRAINSNNLLKAKGYIECIKKIKTRIYFINKFIKDLESLRDE